MDVESDAPSANDPMPLDGLQLELAELDKLEPVFFPVSDPDEKKRINEYRHKYREYRRGEAFGAKGELTTETVGTQKPSNPPIWVQPPFITKLRNMVDNPENAQYVRWTAEGNAILVNSLQEFAEKILPKYFKHSNFPSFLRQLNMYHFTTSRQGQNWREFRNQHFQRGKLELQQMIKRRPASSSASSRNAAKRKEADMERSKQLSSNFQFGVASDFHKLHTMCVLLQHQNNNLRDCVVQLQCQLQVHAEHIYAIESAAGGAKGAAAAAAGPLSVEMASMRALLETPNLAIAPPVELYGYFVQIKDTDNVSECRQHHGGVSDNGNATI